MARSSRGAGCTWAGLILAALMVLRLPAQTEGGAVPAIPSTAPRATAAEKPAAAAAPAPTAPPLSPAGEASTPLPAKNSFGEPMIAPSAPAPIPAGSPADAALPGANAAPVAPTGVKLRLLAPAGNFPPWLLQYLLARTGVEVSVEPYANNEDALAKASNAAAPCDLLAISDRLVVPLVAAHLLAELKLPANFTKPAAIYTSHYLDRDNRYVLPYGASLLGFAYRADVITPPPAHWLDLFSQANYGRTVWPPDVPLYQSLVARIGLKADGQPPRTSTGGQIFPLEVNSIANLRRRFGADAAWRIALPAEGSMIFLYELGIGAGSPHPEQAQLVFDTIFTPAVVARLATESGWAATQRAALSMLPAGAAKDPLSYPSTNVLNHCTFVKRP